MSNTWNSFWVLDSRAFAYNKLTIFKFQNLYELNKIKILALLLQSLPYFQDGSLLQEILFKWFLKVTKYVKVFFANLYLF